MSGDTRMLLVTVVASVVGSAVAVIAVVLTLGGGVRADLRAVHERLDRLDDRLGAVEIAFGKVDQRLLTIERIVLPAPDPAG